MPLENPNFSDGCCVFPFTYIGITYNECTNVDHNQGWCATKVDAEGKYYGFWKDCNENCKKGERNRFLIKKILHKTLKFLFKLTEVLKNFIGHTV